MYFFIRAGLLIAAYFIYFINIFFCLVGLSKIASRLLEIFAFLLTKALGIQVVKKNKVNVQENSNYLYIANHDSIIDTFVVQSCLCIRTLIDDRIKKFPVPFFSMVLSKYGHFLFDKNNRHERKLAFSWALNCLKYQGRFFIFPSGGIKPITEFCSSSVYTIAKKNNARIVPVFIDYHPREAFVRSTLKDNHGHAIDQRSDISLLFGLMRRKKSVLSYSYGHPIDIDQFQGASELIKHIQACYRHFLKESHCSSKAK